MLYSRGVEGALLGRLTRGHDNVYTLGMVQGGVLMELEAVTPSVLDIYP